MAALVLTLSLSLTACQDAKARQENEQLKAQVTSAQQDNAQLRVQVDHMSSALEAVQKENDALKAENESLKAKKPSGKTSKTPTK